MKKITFIFFLAFTVLISCNTPKTNKDSSTSSLTHLQKNKYAAYFKIYAEENYSALITYINIEKTDSIVYVIYNNQKPNLNYKAYYIQSPVTYVGCMGSVFVGSLNNLQLLNSIAAIDNADYIYNPTIKKKCVDGNIQQLSKSGVLNIEQTLACKPQLLFTNPSGDVKKDFDNRLLKANIIPVVCADYYENTALARAEWVKALAIFFNKEQIANSLFDSTEKKYLQLKNMADTCKYKPTVLPNLTQVMFGLLPEEKATWLNCLKMQAQRMFFTTTIKQMRFL